MTFLLWADDEGRLVALEGASFNEDISALDFDAAQIEFHPAPDGGSDDLPPSPELLQEQFRRRPRRA